MRSSLMRFQVAAEVAGEQKALTPTDTDVQHFSVYIDRRVVGGRISVVKQMRLRLGRNGV